MTDSELIFRWIAGMAAAGGVVVVVATLVIAIIDQARGILDAVVRCRRAVERIEENVAAIPQLETTNLVAGQILGGALAIEGKVHLLADTLESRKSASASLTGA